VFRAGGESWYNSLQVNLRKKVSHGLEFQTAYTYSKLLDDTEGLANSDTSGTTANTLVDPFDPMVDYGPSNFDVKHDLHINALYHLPRFGARGFVDKIINGWWTGSIVSIRTGLPFSPLLSADRQQAGLAGTNGGLERPDYVTSSNIGAVTAAAVAAGITTCPVTSTSCIPYNPVIYNPKTVITGQVSQWFNANMFTLPTVGTLGNVSRNILREPGSSTWDFSLNKDTAWGRLGEQGRVEFRAEAFNVLNHTNFGTSQNGGFMSGTVADVVERPNFTGITNTSTPTRQIQFALKFLF